MVSHSLLIEMIHRSRLWYNLVRWLVAYLCGRKASCLYHQHISPPRQVWAGVPLGSVISPALFNHFVSDCPIPDFSIVEAEARANQFCSTGPPRHRFTPSSLVRWADGKQLAIAPQKSSVTLFTSDTHQTRLHPQVRIGDVVAPLNRTPKILGVHRDTHFTFGPHVCDCVERSSSALNVVKALAGLN